jgi:hypothetical protein
LGIGTTTPNASLNVSLSSGTLSRFTTGTTGNVIIEKIQTPGGIDGPILSFARADGTFPSSPSNVQINRGLGVIDFYGYFTGDYRAAGGIKSFVDGTALATSMPMRLEFLTSTDGTITPTVKMTLKNNGNLILQNGGTFTDTGERLQVSGSSRFVGDMVITGSGATSATYAFTVQNSNGANILRTRSDGAVYIESVNSVAQLFFSGNDAQIQRSTSGLNGLGMYGPANASHTLTISSFSSDNYGNGALSSLRFSGNFISSTGNTAFSYMG